MNILPIVSKFTRALNFKGMERILRLFYSPDKRIDDFFETVMHYEGRKIHINTSSFIEWTTYFKGHYELNVTKFINSVITSDSISIDAGANIGLHTIEMTKGKRVYAFEPNPLVCQRLKENLALSEISNVEVAQIGLSNVKGTVDFYIPLKNNSHQGLGSMYPEHVEAGSEKIQIQVSTIDELFKDLEKLDFIKIDVEEHDFNVILGAEKTIERLRPVILFEFSREWNNGNYTLEDAKKFFSSKRYSLTTLNGKSLLKKVSDFAEIIASPN